MSHFNYCPCVWHFGRRTGERKIDNVQFRCLKYIYNDFTPTYGELRKRAQRPVMYVQRLRAKLIEMNAYFKIGPKYMYDILRNPSMFTHHQK